MACSWSAKCLVGRTKASSRGSSCCSAATSFRVVGSLAARQARNQQGSRSHPRRHGVRATASTRARCHVDTTGHRRRGHLGSPARCASRSHRQSRRLRKGRREALLAGRSTAAHLRDVEARSETSVRPRSRGIEWCDSRSRVHWPPRGCRRDLARARPRRYFRFVISLSAGNACFAYTRNFACAASKCDAVVSRGVVPKAPKNLLHAKSSAISTASVRAAPVDARARVRRTPTRS